MGCIGSKNAQHHENATGSVSPVVESPSKKAKKEEEEEETSEHTQKRTVVMELWESEINVDRLLVELRDPSTQAVRLHGSRNVQNMLRALSTQEQMNEILLLSRREQMEHVGVPVVVLVAGDSENTKDCAGYVAEAWEQAVTKIMSTGQPTSTTCTSSPQQNLSWFVSNHSFAVNLKNISEEVPQANLPPGCQG